MDLANWQMPQGIEVFSLLALVAACASAVWVFRDAARRGVDPRWTKMLVVALAVLSIPGPLALFVPQFGNQLRNGHGDSDLKMMVALGIIAGAAAVAVAVYYANSQRQAISDGLDSQCPYCGARTSWEWEVCPNCHAQLKTTPHTAPTETFFDTGQAGTSGATGGIISENAATGAATVYGMYDVGLGQSDDNNRTRILRPKPLHTAWLTALNGPHQGHDWRLGDETRIGRGIEAPCEIVLQDPTVSSGQHALIRLEDNGFLLADLASKNGTWVNGEPVLRYMLQDHDRITIGETEMVFMQVSETAKAGGKQ